MTDRAARRSAKQGRQREPESTTARFDAFLEAAPDVMVVTDTEGRIVAANAQTQKLFGHDPASILGQRIEILVPRRFHARHEGHRNRYIADPHTRPMGAGLDLQGLRKDGAEFPVEISLSPIQTDDGHLVIAAIRDVTDRRRIERTLQEKNVELERASHVKDHFLSSISHELRTPLNAIIGFTGTLLMRLPGPLTPEQEEQLRTVQTSGRHLLSIINDLLDLAKIESGKVALQLEAVSCRSVVGEVVSTLTYMADAKGLTLDVRAPAEDVLVQADRRALSQILINLANNAIKFTDAGGVSIRVAREHRAGRRVAEISVSDTGAGIPPEEQARLFHAFELLDSAAARRTEGSGLGLHLSQKLAALLGGHITFASAAGKGSTFTLVIPEPAA